MVSKMPVDDQGLGLTSRALTPSPSELRDYMTSQGLVLLVTDKNLGCAIAPRSWILDKTASLLNSVADYIEVDRKAVVALISEKVGHMERIARSCEHWDLQSQLPDYFRSQYRDSEAEYLADLPRFYVIPKIHKSPIAARPILPCHSVVQGPAGKFVSKLLKPVIRAAPYIIHGTKHLVLQLSKLHLPHAKLDGGRLKRLYLVSGDVVAFYPNVNVKIAHDIAVQHLMRWYSEQDEIDPHEAARWIAVFRECLSAADDDLVTQFDGKYYKQARGLAMGVASSPDLANLYGLDHELFSKALRNPDVAFYGRYIDDCLALIYAVDEFEALRLMRDGVTFTDCTIKWTSSSSHMTFLDMTLFFEDNALHWKPFRKQMNHFERIPWISAHPLYVKRGTFVSELSRLATLSSRFDDFASACKEASDIYIARGYPPLLIASWLRENYRARWEARLRETPPERADVLVLKSEYNTSWDLFNVQYLSEQMKSGWMQALNTLSFGNRPSDIHPEILSATRPNMSRASATFGGADPSWATGAAHETFVGRGMFGEYLRLDKLGLLDRRLLVSKKKTTQLMDLAAMWRRSVLERRDRQALHDGTLDSWIIRK
jgi:hypothetical protein